MTSDSKPSSEKLICFCNRVPKSTVQSLIDQDKVHNLNEVYDACGAGVGPCGGSCRDSIVKLFNGKDAPKKPSPTPGVLISDEMVYAISLFNRRYYWETHEVLEDVWREESGQQKIFTQALIQAAAALYHVLNGNPQGVLKLAQTSLEKLASVPLDRFGVDCNQLIDSLKHYIVEARAILAKEKDGFDFARLPSLSHGMNMGNSSKSAGD